MDIPLWRGYGFVWIACALIVGAAVRASADEIWVAPTSQADIGGLGVASNAFWPVTPAGVVRLAWSIPGNLQTLQGAKVAIIPGAPAGGPPALHFFVCAAENGDTVSADCTGPFVQVFTSTPNQLVDVEIGGVLSQHIGTAGSTYLAVLAYTTPALATDHIVGLRFSYTPATPAGVATLGANTFSGTQTATAFAGDGAGVSNVNATLLDGLDSTAFAAAVHGHDVSQITGAARLSGGNAFTGTQTIGNGNLDLNASTAATGNITKSGARFLHNFGSSNVFLGLNSGNVTLAGSGNVGVGGGTLANVTTGGANTAVGHASLVVNQTGTNNTAMGWEALGSLSSGNNNTAIGEGALLNLTTGSLNVGVGQNAGIGNSTGSNNIYLGAGVTPPPGESNAMYLGKVGVQTKAFISGVRGITTVNPDAVPVVIDSAGQLGTISSSIRFKDDIHDMADASRRLFDLRPVTFRYTQAYANGVRPVQYGLIAEEVAAVFPELAVRDANGGVETVHYETLNVLLLNELKKEHDEVRRQRERIEVLERRLDDLVSGRAIRSDPLNRR